MLLLVHSRCLVNVSRVNVFVLRLLFFRKETTNKSKEIYVRTDGICLGKNQNEDPVHKLSAFSGV